jgi:FixJ family two-component response regulator
VASDSLVCLVDDDLSVRESVSGVLRSIGFDVRAFESAEAFLSEAEVARTDCLILDVTMPGMSGVELQEFLIADGHSVPIVFITARAEPALQTRVMERGAIACLAKPFPEGSLLLAIETALDAKNDGSGNHGKRNDFHRGR